jgi:hypothetical protein
MSKGWSKSQKLKFLQTMKRKKEEKEKNKFPDVPLKAEALPVQTGMLAQENIYKNYEYHYRRGLVTAMECILRELR